MNRVGGDETGGLGAEPCFTQAHRLKTVGHGTKDFFFAEITLGPSGSVHSHFFVRLCQWRFGQIMTVGYKFSSMKWK